MKKYFLFLKIGVILFSINSIKTVYGVRESSSSSDEKSSSDETSGGALYDLSEILRKGPRDEKDPGPVRKSRTCSELPELSESGKQDRPSFLKGKPKAASWDVLPGFRRRKTPFNSIEKEDLDSFKLWLQEAHDINIKNSKTGNTPLIEIGKQLVEADRRFKALRNMLGESIQHEIDKIDSLNKIDFLAQNKKGETIISILKASENPGLDDVAHELDKIYGGKGS